MEYLTVGYQVDLLPSMLRNKCIHLSVCPEFRQLLYDKEHSVEVDGQTIPGSRTQWCDMAAELTSQQTMIAVLVRQNTHGKRVGFVTMVRPTLAAPSTKEGVTSGEMPIPVEHMNATHVEPSR